MVVEGSLVKVETILTGVAYKGLVTDHLHLFMHDIFLEVRVCCYDNAIHRHPWGTQNGSRTIWPTLKHVIGLYIHQI